MAPSNQPAYAKDERVLCFHHELLYEAKVLDSKLSDASDKKSALQYRVHYKGWKNTWDDWVPQDRLRKLTDENKELAQNLKKEMDALRQRTAPPKAPTTSTKKKAAGSDLSSGRGSEERHSSLPATGRGQKRGRDYEIEKVGGPPEFASLSPLNPSSLSTLSSASSGRSSMEDTTHVVVGSFHHAHVNFPGFPDGAINAATPSTSIRRGRSRNLWQKERDAVGGIEDDPKASLLPTAEKILSRPPPVDSRRKAMLRKEPERAPIEQHPQLAKLNVDDPGNEPKRQFFKAQDAKSVLMLAGYSEDYSLHPLRSNCGGNPNDHDNNTWQEESFLQRPAVRIVIPDHLKAILVDDWENVTKNLSLVPLPSKHPVSEILDAYWEEEKGKRRLGSPEADLLLEVVAGVREYFEKCLGRILLYRFEREQFFEVRQLWEAGTGEWEGKGVGDVYGAEHLCRLFVTMPELIAQTNMDQQSVNRLREELAKLTQWLGKNSSRFFTSDYEAATQDYIEKARGV